MRLVLKTNLFPKAILFVLIQLNRSKISFPTLFESVSKIRIDSFNEHFLHREIFEQEKKKSSWITFGFLNMISTVFSSKDIQVKKITIYYLVYTHRKTKHLDTACSLEYQTTIFCIIKDLNLVGSQILSFNMSQKYCLTKSRQFQKSKQKYYKFHVHALT